MEDIRKKLVERAYANRERLIERLRKSYALELLWPAVFDHGSASSVVVMRGKSGVLKVRNGAGEERSFPLEDVPDILKQPNESRTAE